MSLTKVSYSMIQGELANILDYGADSTGAASSSAALDAAIASGKSVYVPAGTYKLTAMSTLTSGVCIYGEGPLRSRFICDVASNTGVFLRMSGGNNIVEKVAFEGNSTANGTAIRMANSANEYTFTGWMTVRDVHIKGIKVGLDMNNVFSVLVDNCRIYSNYRGVRIVPSYSASADSGYFTTVTLNKCYINQNTDYGLAASPTIVSHSLVLRDCVIEDNTGTASAHQSSISKVDPFVVENCYFELKPAIPALLLDQCVTTIHGIYLNGTGGINLGSSSNTLYVIDAAIGASTDAIYANGTSLQQIQVVNSSFGTCTLNATRLLFQNSTLSGTYYRNFASNYDLTLSGNLVNTTRVSDINAYTKTITQTISANSSARLITDQPVSNLFSTDWAVGVAQMENFNPLGLILTVGPSTTGDRNYFCVNATNTTGSNIVLTSVDLTIVFIKGGGAIAI
jgi:hypothetical protein